MYGIQNSIHVIIKIYTRKHIGGVAFNSKMSSVQNWNMILEGSFNSTSYQLLKLPSLYLSNLQIYWQNLWLKFIIYICRMYDVDGNGVIDQDEMTKIVQAIYDMLGAGATKPTDSAEER